MKILFTSDLHLNMNDYGVMDKNNPQIPFRTMDALRAFEQIVSRAIETGVNLFIVNGDIYDNPRPSVFVNSFFYKQLTRLTDNGIGVILLVGNHDVGRNYHPLEPLQHLNLKKVKIIDEPKIFKYNGVNFVLFPFSRDIANKSISIREKFQWMLEECEEKQDDFGEDLTIFCGHFPVNGAIVSKYNVISLKDVSVAKSKLINNNPNDLTLKELSKIKADYIFLGDYHKNQKLKIKTEAHYCGSIERTDISEREENKGFYILNTETKDLVFEDIKNLRDMINVKGTYKDILKQLKATRYSEENISNPIIKLSFIGNSADYFIFQNEIGDLKRTLIDKYKPVHIFDTKKILSETQTIKDQDIFDDLDISDISESLFDGERENMPSIDKNMLKNVAEEILNEINETADVIQKSKFYLDKYFEEIN